MRTPFDVDEPKLARSIRRRLVERLHAHFNGFDRRVTADLWPLVAEAYSAGYKAGHEDQMQARIRDAMERNRLASAKGDAT